MKSTRSRGFWLGCATLALATLGVAGCNLPGCAKKSDVTLEVKKGTLSPEPIRAAKELGVAAAIEKDSGVLAGKLLAFLEQLRVPVISTDGESALVTGKVSDPPTEIVFWEPMIAGLSRATTLGDTRPMSVVAQGFLPGVSSAKLAAIDFGAMFTELASMVRQDGATTSDARLVTAIAEELEARGDTSADPRIGPVGSALFGMWLSLYEPPPSHVPAPFVPAPTAPKKKPRGGGPSDTPVMQMGMMGMFTNGASGGGGSCSYMEKLMKGTSTVKTIADWMGSLGKYLPGKVGGFAGAVNDAMSELSKGTALPLTVLQGLVGMAIAAFVDVDGDVKPVKVKYGDGPVDYQVKVTSVNPFSKQQMDKFINCLQQAAGAGGFLFEDLRKIPPRGPVASAPVLWAGQSRLDPPHGKFTVEDGANKPPKGLLQQLEASARGAAAGVGVTLTDNQGLSKAKFQVKGDGTQRVTTVTKSFLVFGTVFPFPVGAEPVYIASNLLFNREVPLRLEVEVPFPKEWEMTLSYDSLTTGGGIQGGWNMHYEGKIPFTLDPKDPHMRFSSNGAGYWTVKFQGSMGGVMQCQAPLGEHPLEISLNGSVKNAQTFDTEFNLNVVGKGSVNAVMKCKALGGVTVNAPLLGPSDQRNAVAGTPVEKFTMRLEEGATKTFPMNFSSTKGSARVTLRPRN